MTNDLNRTFGDTTVYVKQWSATKALENLSRLLSVAGEDATTFIHGQFYMGDIVALMQREDIVPLVKDFCTAASINGAEVSLPLFDKYYQDDLMLVFKVFGMVCEVQYKEFFMQGRSLQDQS